MSAFIQIPGVNGYLSAAADYSASIGLAVIQTGTTAVLCSALGQRPIGILRNAPALGAYCDIVTGLNPSDRIVRAVYGGTVAAGDELVANAVGKLISKNLVAAGAVAGYVIAVALTAGVLNDTAEVLVVPPPVIAPSRVIPIHLTLIAAASANRLTSFPIGRLYGAGRILSLDFGVTDVFVGASGAGTMNAEIDTVDVTGGVLTFAVASGAAGTMVAGTAVTAANAFTASSVLDVELVVGTAFTSGAGTLFLTIA